MSIIKSFLIIVCTFLIMSCGVIKPYRYWFVIEDITTEPIITLKEVKNTNDSLITISGFAYDCQGEKAINAAVYLAKEEDIKYSIVDFDGSFTIQGNQTGKYFFEISDVGDVFNDTLKLKQNHHYKYEIVLGKTGIHKHVQYKSAKKLSESEREKIYQQFLKERDCSK